MNERDGGERHAGVGEKDRERRGWGEKRKREMGKKERERKKDRVRGERDR